MPDLIPSTAVEYQALRQLLRPTGGRQHPGAFMDMFDGVFDNVERGLGGATMVVGAEASNTINVAIQLTTHLGTALAARHAVQWYLAGDANGDTIGTAHSTAPAIGTDGLLINESSVTGVAVSEADGDIDIDFVDTGTGTVYLCLVMPDGSLVVSDAITHA